MLGIEPGAVGYGSKYANYCAMLPPIHLNHCVVSTSFQVDECARNRTSETGHPYFVPANSSSTQFVSLKFRSRVDFCETTADNKFIFPVEKFFAAKLHRVPEQFPELPDFQRNQTFGCNQETRA